MTNSISLNKPQILALRKIVSFLSILLSCVLWTLILGGIVPFRGRAVTPFLSINLIFELIQITRKSPWFCLSCGGFGIIYIVVLIKAIKNIWDEIKEFKNWFASPLDSPTTRAAAAKCVRLFNNTVTDLFFLSVVSRFLYSYEMSTYLFTTLIVCACFIILLNSIVFILKTGLVFKGITVSVAKTTLLLITVTYAFFVANVQLQSSLEAMGGFFSLLSVSVSIPFGYIARTFLLQFVFPILYIVVSYSFFCVAFESLTLNSKISNAAKSILVRSLVFLAILLLAIGMSGDLRYAEDFILLLEEHIPFVLLNFAFFFVSFSTEHDAKELDFLDPPPKEETAA